MKFEIGSSHHVDETHFFFSRLNAFFFAFFPPKSLCYLAWNDLVTLIDREAIFVSTDDFEDHGTSRRSIFDCD